MYSIALWRDFHPNNALTPNQTLSSSPGTRFPPNKGREYNSPASGSNNETSGDFPQAPQKN